MNFIMHSKFTIRRLYIYSNIVLIRVIDGSSTLDLKLYYKDGIELVLD